MLLQVSDKVSAGAPVVQPLPQHGTRARSRFEKLLEYYQNGWIIGAFDITPRLHGIAESAQAGKSAGSLGEYDALVTWIRAGYVVELLGQDRAWLRRNTGLRGAAQGSGFPDFRIIRPEELATLTRANYHLLGALLEVKSFRSDESLDRRDVLRKILRAREQIEKSPYFVQEKKHVLQLNIYGQRTPEEYRMLDEVILGLQAAEVRGIGQIRVHVDGKFFWGYDRRGEDAESGLTLPGCAGAFSSS